MPGPRKPAPKRQPVNKTVSPPTSHLPRLKSLPRELLPQIGKTSFGDFIDDQFNEYRNINEHLPSLVKVNGSKSGQNLASPIESLTISGERDTYFVNCVAKLVDAEEAKPLSLFMKRVHLVEPIKAMEGVYAFPDDGSLPHDEEGWQRTLVKIHSVYNEAYIDTLCAATLSRLVETDKSPHWIRFYGTFNCRVENYLYNITGEISTLRYEKWFKKNKEAGLFDIRVVGDENSVKPHVHIVDEGSDIDCDDLDSFSSRNSSLKADSCKSEEPNTDDEGAVKLVERPVRITKLIEDVSLDGDSISSDDDENQTSDDSVSHSNQCDYYADLPDFPVQVTLLERCEGTMDSLLDDEEMNNDEEESKTKDDRWSAWLIQIVGALTTAQYYYGFVHNDLHTNNIMFVHTPNEYLYYRLVGANGGEKYYKVPTYNRLMKIIDFGRASFWLSDRTDLLITDSYAPNNDAAGQYNCPPFFDKKEPRVEPSSSFDLCRLAVSMFDALYPEQPTTAMPLTKMSEEKGRITYKTESELYNLLWKWLTDEEGKNILRKPDDTERFPDFDLYKHIAKHAKQAVPREEIQNSYFMKKYLVEKSSIPPEATVWDIPCQ